MRPEHEGLEEPARVREMPLDRARVGHRLDRAILGRQRCGERFGRGADRAIARREGRRLCWLREAGQGRAVVHGSALYRNMRN